MFNNLVESSSHRREFKRRGSFLIFTAATYAVLFVIAGVVSIYAYDAKLNQQSTELTILTFAPLEPATPSPPTHTTAPASSNNSSNVDRAVRPYFVDSVNNSTNPPRDVGTTAPSVPPAPPNAVIGNFIADPGGNGKPGTNGVSNSSGGIGNALEREAGSPPPQLPVERPKPNIVRSLGVLNGKAISLPKPVYPLIAKTAGAQGTVTVQVLIDEEGKVVSAKAVSGHPLLVAEAQRAAYQARFSPTMLGPTAVKVSGVITYNFVLQR